MYRSILLRPYDPSRGLPVESRFYNGRRVDQLEFENVARLGCVSNRL